MKTSKTLQQYIDEIKASGASAIVDADEADRLGIKIAGQGGKVKISVDPNTGDLTYDAINPEPVPPAVTPPASAAPPVNIPPATPPKAPVPPVAPPGTPPVAPPANIPPAPVVPGGKLTLPSASDVTAAADRLKIWDQFVDPVTGQLNISQEQYSQYQKDFAAYETALKAQKTGTNAVFAQLFPTEFAAAQKEGWSADQVFNYFTTLISSDMETFVAKLKQMGQTPETQNLLLFFAPSLTQEDLDNLLGPTKYSIEALPQLLKTALPGLFPATMDSEEVDTMIGYLASRPDMLRRNLIAAGMDSDSIALVKALYPKITEQGIKDYFNPRHPETVEGVNLEPQAPKTAWQTAINAVRLSIAIIESESSQVLKVIGDAIFSPDDPNRRIFNDVAQANKWEFQQYVEKHPELAPNPNWAGGVTEHGWGIYTDPNYWAYIIASNSVMSLAAVATTLSVGVVNPVAGLVAGFAVMAPSQIKQVNDAVLAALMEKEKNNLATGVISQAEVEQRAARFAIPVGIVISAIENVGDIPFLKAISPAFMKAFSKNASDELVKLTFAAMVKKGFKTFGEVEFAETMEEIAQQAIQNAAVKTINDKQDIFEGMTDTIIQTLIATAPMALIGGASSIRALATQRFKTELSNQWNDAFQKAKDEGLDDATAELKANMFVAETPEGKRLIQSIVEQLQESAAGRDAFAIQAQETLQAGAMEQGGINSSQKPPNYSFSYDQFTAALDKVIAAKQSSVSMIQDWLAKVSKDPELNPGKRLGVEQKAELKANLDALITLKNVATNPKKYYANLKTAAPNIYALMDRVTMGGKMKLPDKNNAQAKPRPEPKSKQVYNPYGTSEPIPVKKTRRYDDNGNRIGFMPKFGDYRTYETNAGYNVTDPSSIAQVTGISFDGMMRSAYQFTTQSGESKGITFTVKDLSQFAAKLQAKMQEFIDRPTPGQNTDAVIAELKEYLAKLGIQTPETGKPFAANAFHGSRAKDIVFEDRSTGTYFSSKRDVAEIYTGGKMWLSPTKPAQVTQANVSFENPLVIDVQGTRHDNIVVPWVQWKPKVYGNLPKNAVSVEMAAAYAHDHGHDGLIVRNVIDTVDMTDRTKSDVYVVFKKDQIKLVTNQGVKESSSEYNVSPGETQAEYVKRLLFGIGRQRELNRKMLKIKYSENVRGTRWNPVTKKAEKISQPDLQATETPSETTMAPSTSVQTGLPGMAPEGAQVQMFGEVSGKQSSKVPLTQPPAKSDALEGQTALPEAITEESEPSVIPEPGKLLKPKKELTEAEFIQRYVDGEIKKYRQFITENIRKIDALEKGKDNINGLSDAQFQELEQTKTTVGYLRSFLDDFQSGKWQAVPRNKEFLHNEYGKITHVDAELTDRDTILDRLADAYFKEDKQQIEFYTEKLNTADTGPLPDMKREDVPPAGMILSDKPKDYIPTQADIDAKYAWLPGDTDSGYEDVQVLPDEIMFALQEFGGADEVLFKMLDKYLAGVPAGDLPQAITDIQGMVGNMQGDLFETYRYESITDGIQVEIYMDKILNIAARYEVKPQVIPPTPWSGPAYRVETGFTQSHGTTAADVVKFETTDLGNDLMVTIPPEVMADMKNRPARDIVWVTKSKKDAGRYKEAGPVQSNPLPAGSIIVGEDGDGGYLVLKGKDEPTVSENLTVPAQPAENIPASVETALPGSELVTPADIPSTEVARFIPQISFEEKLAEKNKVRQDLDLPEFKEEEHDLLRKDMEASGLRAYLDSDPVAQFRVMIPSTRKKTKGGVLMQSSKEVGFSLDSLRFRNQKEGGFATGDSFTRGQAMWLMKAGGQDVMNANPLKDGRIRADEALDGIAQQLGIESAQELIDKVNHIIDVKHQILRLEGEVVYLSDQLAASRPLTPFSSPEPGEFSILVGGEMYTTDVIDALVGWFADYINSPDAVTATELTRELQRKARAGRGQALVDRTEQLLAEGIGPELAMKQAQAETLAGKLPRASDEFITQTVSEMRDALFAKVYIYFKDKPSEVYERVSTITALTNLLANGSLPRAPGSKGGSAYTRLQRVFGGTDERVLPAGESGKKSLFTAIEKMAEEKKPLRDIVAGVFHKIDMNTPFPTDWKPEFEADFWKIQPEQPNMDISPFPPREPSRTPTKEEIARGTFDLLMALSPNPEGTGLEYKPFEPEIQEAFKLMPMIPIVQKHIIVRALKEAGMTAIDIGNFLRANKASFDFSWWRQQAPLIVNHKSDFIFANIEAWKAMWNQKSAEASWDRITHDPLYHYYEQSGYDFLRPLHLPKGSKQWQGTEEFGYGQGSDRPIPKFTESIPWVKTSERAFITGTNEHNWRVFKDYYKATLRVSEKIAAGQIKLKPGEVFDIQHEMTDMARLLGDFTGRAKLGKASALSATLSAFFFAPRYKLGRILTPTHLFSANPRIRREAFADLAMFVSVTGGILLLGKVFDLWDVETDKRSSDFMKIRIGNAHVDPWGGYQQLVVFVSRIFEKTGISSITGQEYPVDLVSAIGNFIRSSSSPLLSLITDLYTGKTFVGDTVDFTNWKQWGDRLAPMFLMDMYEAFKDSGLPGWEAGVLGLSAGLGAGVQSYSGDWTTNFKKVGLPKYDDNLPFGITKPVYDVKDFWSDTASQFNGVDPVTITTQKGYPAYLQGIVAALQVKDILSTMPNDSLIGLNADQGKGDTYREFYLQWQERQKLVAAGDANALKEFDTKYPHAYYGNIGQRSYALLEEYYSLKDDKARKAFLAEHPEMSVNLRDQWLTDHPKENAMLAVWGQASIMTEAAWSQAQTLIKEWDIPASAVAPYVMPADVSASYFAYQKIKDKYGDNSPQAQLALTQDDKLRKYLGKDVPNTPIVVLQLQIKDQKHYDALVGFSDPASPSYIADATKRAAAIAKYKTDNPDFQDDLWRIDIMSKGTNENPIDSKVVDLHLEYNKLINEPGVGTSSAAAMLFRVDNPAYDTFRTDANIWGNSALKPIDESQIPIWRMNVRWATQDAAYQAILDQFPGAGKEQSAAIKDFLEKDSDYEQSRLQRVALTMGLPAQNVSQWVEYNQLPTTGSYRERYRMAHPDFETAVKSAGVTWAPLDPGKVLPESYDKLYEQFKDLFDQYENLTGTATDKAKQRQELFSGNPAFKEAYYLRAGYEKGFGDEYSDDYANYMTMPASGYARDRYLKEHSEFYRTAFKLLGWTTLVDFDKVPSEKVESLYTQYSLMSTTDREKFRLANPDLDKWLVLTSKVSGPVRATPPPTPKTPPPTKPVTPLKPPPSPSKPKAGRSGTIQGKAAEVDESLGKLKDKLAGVK